MRRSGLFSIGLLSLLSCRVPAPSRLGNLNPRHRNVPVMRGSSRALKPRRAKLCLLKSCGKVHTHNNSWCCAEHCRQWRAENPFNGKGRP